MAASAALACAALHRTAMADERGGKRARVEQKDIGLVTTTGDAFRNGNIQLVQVAGGVLNADRPAPAAASKTVQWVLERLPDTLAAQALFRMLEVWDRQQVASVSRRHRDLIDRLLRNGGGSPFDAVWSRKESQYVALTCEEHPALRTYLGRLQTLTVDAPLGPVACHALHSNLASLDVADVKLDSASGIMTTTWPKLRRLVFRGDNSVPTADFYTRMLLFINDVIPNRLTTLDFATLTANVQPAAIVPLLATRRVFGALTELGMPMMPMIDQHWKLLGQACPQLTRLRLTYRSNMDVWPPQDVIVVTDGTFQLIARQWPHLTEFQWHCYTNVPSHWLLNVDWKVTAQGWIALAKGCPAIKTLDIRLVAPIKHVWVAAEDRTVEQPLTKATPDIEQAFAHWPLLQELELGTEPAWTPALLTALNQYCRQLRSVSVGDHASEDDVSAEAHLSFLEAHPRLECLPLHTKWSDAILVLIGKRFQHLHTLDTGYSRDFVADAKAVNQVLAGCRSLRKIDTTVNMLTDDLFSALIQLPPADPPARWRPPTRPMHLLRLYVTESVHMTGAAFRAIGASCPQLIWLNVEASHDHAVAGQFDISIHDIQDLVSQCPKIVEVDLAGPDDDWDADDIADDDYSHVLPLARPVNPLHLEALRRMTRASGEEATIRFTFNEVTDEDSPIVAELLERTTGSYLMRGGATRYWARIRLEPIHLPK